MPDGRPLNRKYNLIEWTQMTQQDPSFKARREGSKNGDPAYRAAASRRSTGRTQDIDHHVGARVRERRIMLLELFVAFLQAYVFALLTAVFIGLMQHEH